MKVRIAQIVIGIYVIIALFHPFIANDTPIPIKIGSFQYDYHAPFPYAYNTIDSDASLLPPFASNHVLGTDIIGRDTFAGVLKGTEISVKIGFLSVLMATLMALIIGLLTAYFKRFPISMSRISLFAFIVSFAVLCYYLWYGLQSNVLMFFIVGIVVIAINVFIHFMTRRSKNRVNLPVNGVYLRIIEAIKAIPSLILLLAFMGIFESYSVNNVIFILAFLMWPGLSRYVRGEALKILHQDYITAAKHYGSSGFRIIYKHVILKLLPTMTVVISFAIASAIIIESTLSYLGLGIPIEEVSWGSMLKEAQRNFSAWWLAIFPGIALFGLVYALNILGERSIELER